MNPCKIGFHNYVCYYAGVYKSFHKCTKCGKEKTTKGSTENKLTENSK